MVEHFGQIWDPNWTRTDIFNTGTKKNLTNKALIWVYKIECTKANTGGLYYYYDSNKTSFAFWIYNYDKVHVIEITARPQKLIYILD